MNKNTEKRRKYNTEVLRKLAEKYQISTRYVRQCITGDRVGVFADEIKTHYKRVSIEMQEALKRAINK